MIQLPSNELGTEEAAILIALQSKIDSEPTFAEKSTKAQTLWNSKGGVKGKKAFIEIRNALAEMCVFVGVCNYCEQSEANDIEHIQPKSFFPEATFEWENYILACKQCNSGHKLDKGFVLNDADELVELVREKQPPFNKVAFINIRKENPQDYMLLNPFTHKFEIFRELSTANKNKAEATIKILELNDRDTLVAARKSSARHFFDQLERVAKINEAKTIQELEALLTPYDDRFDFTRPLEDLKNEIRESFKKYISTYQHPSVWQTIKIVQAKTDSKWIGLFKRLPEALNW